MPEGLSPSTLNKAIQELSGVIKGHEERIRVFVASQVLGLPALLIGSHGTGKTRLVKVFSKMLYVNDRPIKSFMMLLKQSHKPIDVFYTYDLPALMRGEERVIPKAIDAELVFLDEIFANELVLSALKDFLEERIYDRFNAKWMFFIAGTNPPNDFYQNILIQRNMADIDRFDVIIPMSAPSSMTISDVLCDFDEAKSRDMSYEPKVTIDVSNISKLREEILTTIKLTDGARAYLWLMSLAFSVCHYCDNVTGQRTRLDKFNVFERLPCERCIYKKFKLCRYALAPMRFARSATMLSKALAWLDGAGQAGLQHIRTAVRYALPLRLLPLREEVKLEAPTIDAIVQRAIADFEDYFREADVLGMIAEALDQLSRGNFAFRIAAGDDPLARAIAEDLEAMARSAKQRLMATIANCSDPRLIEPLTQAFDGEIAELAKKRLDELRGVVVISDSAMKKRLLKELLLKGVITDEEFSQKAIELNLKGAFALKTKDITIEPQGESLRVYGDKRLVDEVLKGIQGAS